MDIDLGLHLVNGEEPSVIRPEEELIYEDQDDQNLVYSESQPLTRQPFQEIVLPDDHDDMAMVPNTDRYLSEHHHLQGQEDMIADEPPEHGGVRGQETHDGLFLEDNDGVQAENHAGATEDTIYDSDKENKAPSIARFSGPDTTWA
ncbi:hypothetical protein B0O80DRAFT_498490 [Mortierella sp. GBAus27b]|nr:hypothetical protein BGX31_000887 [Mortierella sp. GBA43]KAI8354485.1 hypothetical protein B0O80DRAFT_498490 [Mortierella sp. GBAus27b]